MAKVKSEKHNLIKYILLLMIGVITGMGVGYFFGFDIGYESYSKNEITNGAEIGEYSLEDEKEITQLAKTECESSPNFYWGGWTRRSMPLEFADNAKFAEGRFARGVLICIDLRNQEENEIYMGMYKKEASGWKSIWNHNALPWDEYAFKQNWPREWTDPLN